MKIFFFLLLCLCTTALTAQDSVQAQLIGKYKFPDGSVVAEVNVVFENGGLTMSSSAGTSALELIKGDSFNVVSFNGIAVFKRNEAKKVVGVHIDASGYVLDGVKDGASLNSIFIKIRSVVPIDSPDQLRKSQAVAEKSLFPGLVEVKYKEVFLL
jgi:hypothetical protein